MADKEKVIKGLEGIYRCISPVNHTCGDCPYQDNRVECIRRVVSDALELLKSETTTPNSPTYFRLMAIKDELETENKTLKDDVKELRRLTGSLTNLCENLLKRIAADERS